MTSILFETLATLLTMGVVGVAAYALGYGEGQKSAWRIATAEMDAIEQRFRVSLRSFMEAGDGRAS